MRARCAPAAALGILALLLPAATAQGRRPPPGEPPPEPPSLDAPARTDPRDVKDPRDVPDPRDVLDPRETEPVDPLLGPPGPDLYDALYSTGQDARLKQALGENGWDLLDYIHRQCDSWLEQRDTGDPTSTARQEKLAALEEKARKLARLADSMLVDSRFQAYVETVFTWNEDQRRLHREGQEFYREGVALMDVAEKRTETQAALTPLQKALDRARQTRDGRTEGDSLVAIGNVQAALRDEAGARSTMQDALRVGRELRNLDVVWTALSVLYESAIRTREWDKATEALQEQYLIAQDVADEATAQQVLRQLVALEKYRDEAR